MNLNAMFCKTNKLKRFTSNIKICIQKDKEKLLLLDYTGVFLYTSVCVYTACLSAEAPGGPCHISRLQNIMETWGWVICVEGSVQRSCII